MTVVTSAKIMKINDFILNLVRTRHDHRTMNRVWFLLRDGWFSEWSCAGTGRCGEGSSNFDFVPEYAILRR